MKITVQQALDTIVSVGTVFSALTPTRLDDDVVALAAAIDKDPEDVALLQKIVDDMTANAGTPTMLAQTNVDALSEKLQHSPAVQTFLKAKRASHSKGESEERHTMAAFDWQSLLGGLLTQLLPLIVNLVTRKQQPVTPAAT